MSNEQYSPIRFKLEESVWLDHHARGAEIISLELEPDIEVMEDENYTTITGSLVLKGRFDVIEEEGDHSLDLESSSLAEQLQFQPLRVEQQEVFEESHRGKISRTFPVDVTVPVNRVSDIDEVYVKVDQFDYNVIDGHLLQIKADVEITGILSEAMVRVEEEQEERSTLHEIAPAPLLPSFDVAASRDENAEYDPKEEVEQNEEPREAQQEAQSEEREENKVDLRAELLGEKQSASEPESARDESSKETRGNTEISEQEKAARGDSTEEKVEELEAREHHEEEEREAEEEKVVPLFNQEIRTVFHSKPSTEEREESEQEPDNDQPREEEPKKSSSLTTSFLTQLMSSRETEEQEQFTRLKMCIIQRNESLESIAERYSIPVKDIMRVNQLSSEQIDEGQILYIPKS
ncbi:LysM peptidoglycan-binding domain-containing protein [Caldalkalibacillus mannanilyticus]|uniref:LysM peptidoglycan-binding domain-containing protein n=1 Tax=Caldalkalibacillus mannanilyticus TaxID=1418 RepID=UPI00046A159E|nr:LysM peptidoglycan-binding domain-containing protein [Caldalkalibacillus mannanilyticus]